MTRTISGIPIEVDVIILKALEKTPEQLSEMTLGEFFDAARAAGYEPELTGIKESDDPRLRIVVGRSRIPQ